MTKKPFDLAQLRDEETDSYAATHRHLEEQGNPVLPTAERDTAVREIKGLLVGDDYLYAEGTLRSILQHIEISGYVTRNQWHAIQNIAANPTRRSHDPGRSSHHSRPRTTPRRYR